MVHLKILMTLMALDIGGAETHVVELSKELTRMGCEIVVASNGGVYVDELNKNGIKHVTLPLHTKRLKSVVKSYFGLKKLIQEENFDIVHAHARIPAFICGMLANRLKFRFITTTHGVYKVNFFWRAVSNWGEKNLSVSYDIKQYLIDNYGEFSDNISVTINGIDTNKFSPNIVYTDIKQELNLEENKRRIVYVSRIDKECADIAFQLADIAPRLYKKYDNIEIILVGDGTAFSDLKTIADKVNKSIGKDIVKLVGVRTDVNQFLASCDIFVGLSRAVLEAMASAKPVIIAGTPGYIGIFNEDKFKVASDTNFCCRGCEPSTSELIYNDIVKLYSMDKDKLDIISQYNRKIVMDYYSVTRMVDDAVNVYNQLTPYKNYKYGDVIISGYYGYKNLGDDSLLQVIIRNLKAIDSNIKITVLSKSPRETHKIYGVNSINRFNILQLKKVMKHAKLIINGGGSLLQNGTSTRSLIYYVYIMKLAKQYNLKLMIYASGIGPLYGDKNKKMSCDILNKADLITLREPSSYEDIKKLNVKNKNIKVTADPAFCLVSADENWIKKILKRENITSNKKYFAIAIREWHSTVNNFETIIVETCNLIHQKYNLIPIFIPMQPKDLDIIKRIYVQIKIQGHILSNLTASELLGILKHMEFVIGMRLHVLIYTASVGVPIIGISYDPKVDAIIDYIKQPYKVDVKDFTSNDILVHVQNVVYNKEKISKDLLIQTSIMREKALYDAQAAIELM